jgi:DNA-binding transcriptional ArsR family regulator
MLTHGEKVGGKPTTEYATWGSMKDRCLNKKSAVWKNYGGRGIKVCKRWQKSFLNFLADMGRRPGKNFDLDRIDNDGDYKPSNCRWATRSQNIRNTRANFLIQIGGVNKCAAEWAEQIGSDRHTVLQRYKSGIRGKELLVSGNRIDRRSAVRRIEIDRLRKQGWKVREIAAHMGISQPAVSNHLTAFRGLPGKTYRT